MSKLTKGQKIADEDGTVLAVAGRDIFLGEERIYGDLLKPDGSMPQEDEKIPDDLLVALDKLGMPIVEPWHIKKAELFTMTELFFYFRVIGFLVVGTIAGILILGN